MRGNVAKSLACGAAAVALAGAMTLASAPADAAFYRGGGFGGFHGGFGGFRGGAGGFHGGFHGPAMGAWRGGGWGHPGWGWRGGGWGHPGWGWRGGWAGRGWGWGGRRWYGGGWNNGWWWGPALAGGLIIGSTWPYWGGDYGYPDYGYDSGCWVYRRVYNRHRHYLGRQVINVCY